MHKSINTNGQINTQKPNQNKSIHETTEKIMNGPLWSQKLANNEAIVCMKDDYCLRMESYFKFCDHVGGRDDFGPLKMISFGLGPSAR